MLIISYINQWSWEFWLIWVWPIPSTWGHCTLPALWDFCQTGKQKALIAFSSLARDLETCCAVKYNTDTVCGGESPNYQCLYSSCLSAPCPVDPKSTRQERKRWIMGSQGQEQTLCCKEPVLTSPISSSDQWSDISILINSPSVLLVPLWFALVKQLTSPCCTFQIWCSHLTSKAYGVLCINIVRCLYALTRQ